MGFLDDIGKGVSRFWGGGKGQSAQTAINPANRGLAAAQAEQQWMSNPRLQAAMQNYARGGSYQDAIGSNLGAADTSGLDSQLASLSAQYAGVHNDGSLEDADRQNQEQQIENQIQQINAQRSALSGMGGGSVLSDALATGAATGNRFASDQVMMDPLYAGLFGKGGMQEKSQGEYLSAIEALKGRDESYGLKDSDLAAYGQAAGNITRQFAGAGQNLASMLADRGLSTGQSGVANQAFSGMMGNQMEQLAQSQRAIAQQRVDTARGLAQNRAQLSSQMSQGLGNLAGNLQGQYYGQNLAGYGARHGQTNKAAELGMNQQALNQNTLNEMFKQQQATRDPGLGDYITGGIKSGIGTGISGTVEDLFNPMGSARKGLAAMGGAKGATSLTGGV